ATGPAGPTGATGSTGATGPAGTGTFTPVVMSTTKTTNQTLPGGSSTIITNWNPGIDTAAQFNPTAGTYTIPINGIYQIQVCAEITPVSGSSNSCNLAININGTPTVASGFSISSATSTNILTIAFSKILSLSAGNVITLNINTGPQSTLIASAPNTAIFDIFQIA
ncbi:hypothetical protein CN585_28540, partial [Bacillus toyonensis]